MAFHTRYKPYLSHKFNCPGPSVGIRTKTYISSNPLVCAAYFKACSNLRYFCPGISYSITEYLQFPHLDTQQRVSLVQFKDFADVNKHRIISLEQIFTCWKRVHLNIDISLGFELFENSEILPWIRSSYTSISACRRCNVRF